jgi:D-serine deaminase-like pyridoxal phosphate-dependent protein
MDLDSLDSLPTPCLVIDAERVRRNIRRMADYAATHGLKLRPHTKTHKSPFVGQLQLQAGACGLTVAKVGEAEVMAEVCDDVLIAYPTVDYARCHKVAQLAHRITTRVAVDSMLAAERLSQAAQQSGSTVHLLVDVDLGYLRTGVQSDEAAVELGKAITRLPYLSLDGIMTYTGHIQGSDEEQARSFTQVRHRLASLMDAWRATGLSDAIVSGGSTPAARQCHLADFFTEIRPGTYVYNDMNTVHGGYVSLDDCAAMIHATVVSDTVPGQVVIDAGSKTLTSDRCGPAPDSGFGLLVDYPEARVTKLTEEHGQIDVSGCTARPRLGERVRIVPNHICVCVNMQSFVWWIEPDAPPESLAVAARGLLI